MFDELRKLVADIASIAGDYIPTEDIQVLLEAVDCLETGEPLGFKFYALLDQYAARAESCCIRNIACPSSSTRVEACLVGAVEAAGAAAEALDPDALESAVRAVSQAAKAVSSNS